MQTEPSAPPASLDDWRMQRLAAVASQHEIRADWVARLRSLEGFCITILCDDSGSMATVCAGATAANPYARQATRWDELRNTVSVLVQLATALDPAGAVDIFFLNRPPVLGVQDAAQLQGAFANPPHGYTPLSRMFAHILQAKAQVLAERRLLLIIATDGQPTDDQGNVRIPEFLGALMHKPQNMCVGREGGAGALQVLHSLTPLHTHSHTNSGTSKSWHALTMRSASPT